MKKLRDGGSAGPGTMFLLVLLGMANLIITPFTILLGCLSDWIRRKSARLTPEGRQMVHRLRALSPDEREAFFARLGEAKRKSWRKLLESDAA